MFSRVLIKDLSPNARKIIDFLKNHKEEAINMNISSLSKKMGCHPSFITRSLKRVGYNGWKDWNSFALKDMIEINPNGDYGIYLKNTLIKSIIKSINNVDMLNLNILINKITNSKAHNGIIFAGNGFSLYICRDQNRRYNRINIKSKYIDEKTGEINAISHNKIIFVVSISGHVSLTKNQITYLKKEKNSTLVLISGLPTEIKDFDFIFNGSLIDNKNVIENQAPTHSRIVIYTILDMIFWKIFNHSFDKNNKLLELLQEY